MELKLKKIIIRKYHLKVQNLTKIILLKIELIMLIILIIHQNVMILTRINQNFTMKVILIL